MDPVDQMERPVRKGPPGYSLIEVMITVLVVSIISAIAIPNFFGALHRSRQRRTMADIRSLATAVESYQLDFSQAPQSADVVDLVAALQPFYMRVLPQKDAWGNDLDYRTDPETYTLESFGRDGVDGLDISLATRDDYDRDILLVNGIFLASPD